MINFNFMKFKLFFCLTIFFLVSGCSQQNSLTPPVQQPTGHLYVHIDCSAYFPSQQYIGVASMCCNDGSSTQLNDNNDAIQITGGKTLDLGLFRVGTYTLSTYGYRVDTYGYPIAPTYSRTDSVHIVANQTQTLYPQL